MKIFTLLLSAPVMALSIVSAADGWLTDMAEARKKAAEENKGLMIEFTGSDWCGPCMHFKQNILSKEEFLNAAQKDFVLVELDYPRKRKLEPEQEAQNWKYAREYSVRAYPTVIFTNAEGKPVYRLHTSRTMSNVLKALGEARESRVEVDDALNKLKGTTGEERLVLISKIFGKIPFELINQFYGELIDEAKNAPGDPTGYVAMLNEKKAGEEFLKIRNDVPEDCRADAEKKYSYFEKEAGRKDIDPLVRQQLLGLMGDLLFSDMKIDAAIRQYEAGIAVQPGTKCAKELEQKKNSIEQNIDQLKLTAGQIVDFERYEKGLGPDVRNNAGRYAEALESYLEGKDLTGSVLAHILHPMAYAMVADGRADQALARLQEAADRMDGKDPSGKKRIIMFKQMIEANKGALEGKLKKSWEKRALQE